MFLLTNDLIQNTTLTYTSGTIVSELPLDNLKHISKSRVTRSSSAGSLVIEGTLIEAAAMSGFIIGQHNFVEGTSYQLELFSASSTPVAYDESGVHLVTADQAVGDLNNLQYNLALWFTTVYNIGSFKLTIIDNTLSYFQLGRLLAGDAIEPKIGVSFGHKVYWKENTKQYRTEAGTLRSDILAANKVIEFSLNTTYESERANIQRSLAGIGKRKEFFISLFPADCEITKEITYSGIVKMTKIPKYPEFAPDFYSAKYIVEEI
jgi:hypothetical protein